MPFDHAALTQGLDREIAAVRAFIDLLRKEQSALTCGENDRIAEFAEAKARHLLELTRYSDERSRWLAGLGVSSDRAGMDRVLREQAGAAVAPRRAWNQLLQLTQIAQQTNTTNGMLISARLNHTQRALNAIFSAARLPGAYGADGGTVSLRTAQHLAVA